MRATWDRDLGEAVGVVLRVWRIRAALTQQQLAEIVGSHREIVSRAEQGHHHQPSLATLFRYARATGGDVGQVLALVDAWYGFTEGLRPAGASG